MEIRIVVNHYAASGRDKQKVVGEAVVLGGRAARAGYSSAETMPLRTA